MAQFFGYLQDPTDPNDYKAEDLLFGAEQSTRMDEVRPFASQVSSPLMKVDLRAFNPSILDQGAAGSCVPHAIAKQIQITWIVEGDHNAPLPNILALFWQSRKAHGAEDSKDGTYPRLSYKALQDYGFTTESVYPYDARLVLKPVPARIYRSSYDQHRQVQYYRTSDDPDTRVASIKAALDQMRPVTLAFRIDKKFLDFSDPLPWNSDGSNLGGHYVLGVGYNDEGVLILNSWGNHYKNAGYVLVRWETIRNRSICTDPYVITFVPRILR